MFRPGDAMHGQVEENIPQVADNGAMIVRKQLDYFLAEMKGIARNKEIQGMDWETQKRVLESETLEVRIFLGMGIYSLDGNARYPDGKTIFLGDREYIQTAKNGKSKFLQYHYLTGDGNPVMMVATPINGDDGKPKAVLFAVLTKWLNRGIAPIKYGKRIFLYH